MLLYLLRWQLSSIVLYPCMYLTNNALINVILANLIGGLIFYWVDRKIFKNR